jgi:hypothetical protein
MPGGVEVATEHAVVEGVKNLAAEEEEENISTREEDKGEGGDAHMNIEGKEQVRSFSPSSTLLMFINMQ